jgi:hypothetical protein
MSDKPPEFSSGNKWMVRALNSVVKFALVHGVNPAGIPGWSQTTDGWQPPRIRPGSVVGAEPWDISITDGLVKIDVGTILKSGDSISEVLTCDNPTDSFTVAAGGYIAIKLDLSSSFDISTYEIVYSSAWFVAGGVPVEFTGTVGSGGFAVQARYYPLWKFVEASTSYSTPVSEGVHGVRLCPREHLRMIISYFRDSSDNSRFLVPDLEVGPRAA